MFVKQLFVTTTNEKFYIFAPGKFQYLVPNLLTTSALPLLSWSAKSFKKASDT